MCDIKRSTSSEYSSMNVVCVSIQNGSELWPRDENGALIFEENSSFSETWEVRKSTELADFSTDYMNIDTMVLECKGLLLMTVEKQYIIFYISDIFTL